MSEVTRKMLNAAHGVTLNHGFVLSHEILEAIYLAMVAYAPVTAGKHASDGGAKYDPNATVGRAK